MIASIAPASIAAWPLAARLANVEVFPNAWHVLVVDPGREEDAAEAVADELGVLLDVNISRRSVTSTESLVAATQIDQHEVLVVHGLDAFDDNAWRELDIYRSRLERAAPTLLIVSRESVDAIPSLAPNLWSWIGDSVWLLKTTEDEPTPDEREERLTELRRHFGFSDAELVRRALDGLLPPEPDIAEWLVLLGQGSLIKGGQ